MSGIMHLNGKCLRCGRCGSCQVVFPEAGKFPQGFMMGLLGFLIGLTWWAMCMMIGTCGCKICRKEMETR